MTIAHSFSNASSAVPLAKLMSTIDAWGKRRGESSFICSLYCSVTSKSLLVKVTQSEAFSTDLIL